MQLRTWVFSTRLPATLDTWGMQARERIPEFKDTVREALKEIHGEGYGASLAYHDVGEVGFAKPNPHVDVVVNGWKLHKGRARELDHVDLEHGGVSKIGRTWMKYVKRAFPEADENVWNFHTSVAAEAERDVWTIAKYHVREVVNFRHMVYDRKTRTVTWTSDKEQFVDPTMTVDAFLHELRDYVRRSGGWMSHSLRSYVGHLADSIVRESAAAFGNEYGEHAPTCRCTTCVGWEWQAGHKITLPDEEREAFGA